VLNNIYYSNGILGCVIGLSLVFGLLSIVLLLGYGLVEIPIQYFHYASNKRSLTSYQIKVAEYDEKLKEKAKKTQTLIEIINEVEVKPEIEEYKRVLQQDVVDFQDMIAEFEQFRITFKSSVSDSVGREFSGVLDYNKLVRLRNRFIYQTTDVVRLICFRREAIENAIFS
jgi:LMBR1-like membrane protein